MIQDLLLRWIVTALFVVSAAECVYVMVGDRRSWTREVGRSLHVAMAIAMTVMAWPLGTTLPTIGPKLFFLLASGWFVIVGIAQSGHRAMNAYHAAMMLAMAWMYAVMSGPVLSEPAGSGGHPGGHGAHHASPTGMPAIPDGGHDVIDPPLIVGINWLCTVGFGLTSLWWLYRFFDQRRADSIVGANRFLGALCQAMMAAGMAIMFAVML